MSIIALFRSCRLFERENNKSMCENIFTERADIFDQLRFFESSFYSINSKFFSQKGFAQISKLVNVRLKAFSKRILHFGINC